MMLVVMEGDDVCILW